MVTKIKEQFDNIIFLCIFLQAVSVLATRLTTSQQVNKQSKVAWSFMPTRMQCSISTVDVQANKPTYEQVNVPHNNGNTTKCL